MKKEIVLKYVTALSIGFLLGFSMFHPLSMVFVRLVHPIESASIAEFVNAFTLPHLPMAVYFGLLGSVMGIINVFYIRSITREKKRVRQLEGLLPICAYCKRIRDDAGKERGEGDWQQIETYLSRKTAADFTHGICPDCFKKVIEEDKEG